ANPDRMSTAPISTTALGDPPMPTDVSHESRLDWRAEGDKCVTLLRDLLRIPTVNRGTNEPGDGNERPAAELLADFLREAGIEPKLYEKTKGRTNVVARVKGTGERPPLLLNAHLDVVEA